MRSVKDSDRKYFRLFIVEFPEFLSLFEEWTVARDSVEEFRLATKMLNRMRTNGWG